MESKNINCFRFDMKIKYVTYITRISGQLKKRVKYQNPMYEWEATVSAVLTISILNMFVCLFCFFVDCAEPADRMIISVGAIAI